MKKILWAELFKYPFSRRKADVPDKRPMKPCIKLVMTLVVRNEEKIIEQNIRFHCAMGADGFIVLDHNSTDGTGKILEKLRKEGLVLEVIKETCPEHRLSVWVNRMVQLARDKYQADWVINADADEFYYSKSLNLKESILKVSCANLLTVESFLFFPDGRLDFLNCPYFVTRLMQVFETEQLGIGRNPLYSEVTVPVSCTKVIHNTCDFIHVDDGNHNAHMRNEVKVSSADINLYHYRIQNFQGYMDRVMRHLESGPLKPDGVSGHIKNLISVYKSGKSGEDYDMRYGTGMRNFLMEQGVVTIDPSVRNFLKYKNIAV